jgi:hypothetical protein
MDHVEFPEQDITKVPHILPHERVFPIQIGGDLFKLSGASISSDGELFRGPRQSLSSPSPSSSSLVGCRS